MSRAINIDATVAEVTACCAKRSARISDIEPLLSGGTRVVLLDGMAAAVIRRAYKGKVLTGPVRRVPLRIRH